MVNLGCVILAIGVTGYYFDSLAANKAILSIGNLLLTPVYLSDYFLSPVLGFQFIGSHIKMFLVLWITFFLSAFHLSHLLVLTNHNASELKNWYHKKYRS
jgi:hypothetical protein